MENNNALSAPGKKTFGYYRPSRPRVLLREPEVCMECNKVYLALYSLRCCGDHEGLEKI